MRYPERDDRGGRGPDGTGMDETDEELIRQYRRGRVGALDELVDRYQGPLYGYIRNMTGNAAEADDVFQEVWMKVIRRVGLYRSRNFGGWLMRIAHNIVIDRLRRRKPEIPMDAEDEEHPGLAAVLASSDAGAAEAVADAELGQRVREAVASLPSEQREVFLLRAESGMPFREIARLQGVSINTALGRMHYALGRLRPLLSGDYAMLGRQGGALP